MLEVRDLWVGYYEDLHILQGVSVTAQTGNITTILGANGVGKSTLLKATVPGKTLVICSARRMTSS